MTDLFSNISFVYWLISTVVGAVILQIIGNLSQRLFDRQLAKVSSTWKARSEARKAKHRHRIELLVTHSDLRISRLFLTFALIFGCILLAPLTVASLVIAGILIQLNSALWRAALLLGALTLLTTVVGAFLIMRQAEMLREVYKILEERRQKP